MNRSILSYAMLAAACMIWGGSFVFGKIIIREMNALDMSFWRSAMAAAFLEFICFLKGKIFRQTKEISSIFSWSEV